MVHFRSRVRSVFGDVEGAIQESMLVGHFHLRQVNLVLLRVQALSGILVLNFTWFILYHLLKRLCTTVRYFVVFSEFYVCCSVQYLFHPVQYNISSISVSCLPKVYPEDESRRRAAVKAMQDLYETVMHDFLSVELR